MAISNECVASLFHGFRIESLVIEQPAPADASSLERIERLARQADTDIKSWPIEKVQAWRQNRALPPLQPAPNMQRALADAKGEYVPWRRPLVIGGFIVLAAAGYGIWRRRTA
jgi:hypothetical protein